KSESLRTNSSNLQRHKRLFHVPFKGNAVAHSENISRPKCQTLSTKVIIVKLENVGIPTFPPLACPLRNQLTCLRIILTSCIRVQSKKRSETGKIKSGFQYVRSDASGTGIDLRV